MGSPDHRLLSLWVSRTTHLRVISNNPENLADEFSSTAGASICRVYCGLGGDDPSCKSSGQIFLTQSN